MDANTPHHKSSFFPSSLSSDGSEEAPDAKSCDMFCVNLKKFTLLNNLHTDYIFQWKEFVFCLWKYYMLSQEPLDQTQLLVLILMHFSCWFQIWTLSVTFLWFFWNFMKNYRCHFNIRMRVKDYSEFIITPSLKSKSNTVIQYHYWYQVLWMSIKINRGQETKYLQISVLYNSVHHRMYDEDLEGLIWVVKMVRSYQQIMANL